LVHHAAQKNLRRCVVVIEQTAASSEVSLMRLSSPSAALASPGRCYPMRALRAEAGEARRARPSSFD
jgi:hypothetical protein